MYETAGFCRGGSGAAKGCSQATTASNGGRRRKRTDSSLARFGETQRSELLASGWSSPASKGQSLALSASYRTRAPTAYVSVAAHQRQASGGGTQTPRPGGIGVMDLYKGACGREH